MAEYRKEKYYWLKLKRDFFKRHDIKVVESMENGKEYILFYMKLLLESIDHNGSLRFSETIPYNEKMLSTITDTNIDIVRSAMRIFNELKLIEILDDATIYLSEVNNMIGQQTYGAERKQLQRQNNDVNLLGGHKGDICPPDIDKELELEKEKELEKDSSKNVSIIKPTDKPTTDKDFMEVMDAELGNDTRFQELERIIKYNFKPTRGDLLTETEQRMLIDWIKAYPYEFIEDTIRKIGLGDVSKRNFRYLNGAITKSYNEWLGSDKGKLTEEEEIAKIIAEAKAKEGK
jgi:predicted phage replisome organizer